MIRTTYACLRPGAQRRRERKTESACDFWEAATQVALFSSRLSQEYVHRALDGNGFEMAKLAILKLG